jgi:hypothetical protein
MAIIYYPNRVYKGKVPAIDRVMAKRNPKMLEFGQSIYANAMSERISFDFDWQMDSVSFSFNNAASKDYGFGITNGRKVVEHLNDYLWLQVTTSPPVKITLTPGFYTGSELATELQTRMNAATLLDGSVNPFNTAAITFTVAYNTTTGLFTITPSSGNIRYLNVNTQQVLPHRDSIAGHLFGFYVDTACATSITSDTSIMGLDSNLAIVTTNGASDTSYYHDTTHIFNIDQAVYLSANSASNVFASATMVYEEII